MSTDKIEKHVDLNAPMSRVWRAISDSKQFGSWFAVRFDEPFVAGRPIVGQFTIKNYEHLTGEFHIDRIDQPAGIFAFRWHPFAIEANVDYSAEPLTTVTMKLSETPTGTHLEITETGFDAIPVARRAKAFAMNSDGWSKQAQNVADYLAKGS